MPQDIRDQLKEKFSIIVTDGEFIWLVSYEQINNGFVAGYGCTECSPIVSAQKPKDVIAGKTGVGPIAPGMRLRIVDVVTEKDMGRNEPGEIRAKGPNVFTGYLSNDGANQEAFDSFGFYKTGDIGIIDDDGHLKITDRAKDLIKYNGFQVSASELEGEHILACSKRKLFDTIFCSNFDISPGCQRCSSGWHLRQGARDRTPQGLCCFHRFCQIFGCVDTGSPRLR